MEKKLNKTQMQVLLQQAHGKMEKVRSAVPVNSGVDYYLAEALSACEQARSSLEYDVL